MCQVHRHFSLHCFQSFLQIRESWLHVQASKGPDCTRACTRFHTCPATSACGSPSPPATHKHTQAERQTESETQRDAPACTHLASRGSGSSGGRRGRTRCVRRAQMRTPAPPARSARPRSQCLRSRTGSWRGRGRREGPSSQQPTSPQPVHPAEGSPVDQVVTHTTVSARLALALVHVQLAAGTGVSWRAHAAVGAHTVQARASVQAWL